MSDRGRAEDDAGRRRLAERDRQADEGERPEEYEQGSWTEPDDPLTEAREQAVEDDHSPSESHPGMTQRDEAWQRSEQHRPVRKDDIPDSRDVTQG
jgi:hypothetical protein